MMPVDPHECERRALDAASYVLGALPEDELESYGEHLPGCVECTAEVAQLQAVADSLALGVASTQTPSGVRARVMAVVNGEAELLRAAGHEADRPARVRPRWRARLQPALVATAALAAGLLVGALAINTGSSLRTQTQTIDATVAAPGYHATAALRKAGSHVELVVAGLPAPPPGRIYQVWLERGTQAPQPTDALFSVTSVGAGSVGVPGDLSGVSEVLVTDEPLGGSLKPTRTPVIVAPV
jgi:anti-sigma-K factor RskA